VRQHSLGCDVHGLQRNAQGTACAHGLDRIAAQVHGDLVQLSGIAHRDERCLRDTRSSRTFAGSAAPTRSSVSTTTPAMSTGVPLPLWLRL
jgi:hypothetical protein